MENQAVTELQEFFPSTLTEKLCTYWLELKREMATPELYSWEANENLQTEMLNIPQRKVTLHIKVEKLKRSPVHTS